MGSDLCTLNIHRYRNSHLTDVLCHNMIYTTPIPLVPDLCPDCKDDGWHPLLSSYYREMLKFNLMKSYIYRWLYLSVFHIDLKNVWWKTLKICCLITFTFTILYNKCNVLCKHQSLATCPQILQGLEFYLFYYCIKNVMFRVITWV